MENRTAVIYCVTNKVNGKMYIGQARDFKGRKQKHLYFTYNGKSTSNYNMHIHASMRKYGVDNFSWRILEDNINLEDIDMLEMVYIDMFDTYNLGYNSTHGGGSTYGYFCSEETKNKISVANGGENSYWFGLKRSPAFCKRISEALTGREVSEETGKKISDANKGEKSAWWGRKHTEESKKKMSQARSGKKSSEETKRRMKEFRTGKKHTEESKRKMSEIKRGDKNPFYGKHHSEETLNKARIPVNQLDLDGRLVKQWDSIKSASLKLGIGSGDICGVCKGKGKTARGFKWEYANK
jgi:group I intron endonuclease